MINTKLNNNNWHEIPLIDNESHIETDNFLIVNTTINNNISKNSWVKDELVTQCFTCNRIFGFFLRKHHCRCCGKIFCYQCSKKEINIPNLYSGINTNKLERVCQHCYNNISDFQYLENIYLILSNLPLNIKHYYKLKSVSKSWNRVIDYYFSFFFGIINRNILTVYTPIEKKILWNNRFILSKHNKWLFNLFLSDTTITNLDNPKMGIKKQCPFLKCELTTCQTKLTDIQIIIIISIKKQLSNYNYQYLLHNLTDTTLLPIFLPAILHNLDPLYADIILNYIFKFCDNNHSYCNNVFWLLTLYLVNDKSYITYRNAFIQYIPKKISDYLQQSYYFVENLIEISNDLISFPNLLNNYINNKVIYSPVNANIKLDKINNENIKIKSSSSRPIYLPFNGEENLYQLLFKKDDVRIDFIAMNIIKTIDYILKKDLDLDLNIITYHILPISPQFGFIEIVPDADTIHHINRDKNFSILNYILEQNPNSSVETIRNIFTKSCVAYCIFSYLLGIGDRHLENIMLKNSGEIFHIDFGFLLGQDPKPLAPEIRITSEMIDAMGGINSKHYLQFKNLCAKCIISLRRHIDLLRVHYSLFYTYQPPINPNFTEEYVNNFINKKFLLGEDINQVKLYLINKISNSSRPYSETLIDFCHNVKDSQQKIIPFKTYFLDLF